MEYKSIFSFDVEWNYKTISLLALLVFLPNLLGMVNLGTVFGFKIHFFQYAVFLAAILYGPYGGLLSGLVGSMYSAFIMHNPYIILGNVILGFFVGVFVRFKMHTFLAVLFAYIIQLLWLIPSDHYLAGLSTAFIWKLVIALALSNVVWAVLAHYSARPLKNVIS